MEKQLPEPKYVKINGITKLNPRWQQQQGQVSSLTPVEQNGALPVYCSADEYLKSAQAMGAEVKFSESTQATEMIFNDSDVQQKVGLGSNMHSEVAAIFGKYEIPFGLMNKLMEFQTFDYIVFLLDDSGSMGSSTDTMIQGRPITRWEETRLRLLEMLELLSVIPTPPMHIKFLNRSTELKLIHEPGMNPHQFLANSTQMINQAFNSGPSGSTPYLRRIEECFRAYPQRRVAWYFFSDGVPDGGEAAQRSITSVCLNRPDPAGNPITFLSCTNDDSAVEWMKNVEEIAPYCSEFDDYQDEKHEVLKDQGNGLPFTKGFYIIGSLVAAMNPEDLDAMDESVPFTKAMLDNLLGYISEEPDYRSYFDQFIQAQQRRPIEDQSDRIKKEINWSQYYQDFIRAESAKEIPAAVQFKQRLKQSSGQLPQGSFNQQGAYATPPVQQPPYEQQSPQQVPYGQPPYGQQASQAPYGQPQYGQQAPYGQPPYGQQAPYGQQSPYGQPPNPYTQGPGQYPPRPQQYPPQNYPRKKNNGCTIQ